MDNTQINLDVINEDDLHLPRLLKKHNLSLADDRDIEFAPGKLNALQIYHNPEGDKFCLRTTRLDLRDFVHDYLNKLYKSMHLEEHGGSIKYLTVEEQVSLMRHLRKMDISVPNVIAYGKQWMLMTFVKGTPLSELLPRIHADETRTVIQSFFTALADVHSKGECLWDRCGKNELAYNEKDISFLDFDIKIVFPDSVPLAIQCNYDLAMGVRACLKFAQHKQTAFNTIHSFLSKHGTDEIYSFPHLARIFAEQTNHYYDMASRPESAAYYAGHEIIDDYMLKLSKNLLNNRRYSNAHQKQKLLPKAEL